MQPDVAANHNFILEMSGRVFRDTDEGYRSWCESREFERLSVRVDALVRLFDE